ncbi:hypothetical protein SD70_15695 [Gordoniibacillus kamchatkensis]|uniref:HTH cro/C1-type domain-containing protein n=1 Tax=Gordoniibacillus kamchatkensis TaxID=1590651 RepID=A0ABR5AHT5_9BACL|nr:hypothetical protein SD70_15695 [Paenibacillus sp. VKM B-2647]
MTERLRNARKSKKITLREMSEKLGIAKSTYAAYESGFRTPSLDTLISISKILGVTSDYLLGLTESADYDASNAKQYLQNAKFHWDGVPLTDEDLELINLLLERIIRDRKKPLE